jgi:hypothetical protein
MKTELEVEWKLASRYDIRKKLPGGGLILIWKLISRYGIHKKLPDGGLVF